MTFKKRRTVLKSSYECPRCPCGLNCNCQQMSGASGLLKTELFKIKSSSPISNNKPKLFI